MNKYVLSLLIGGFFFSSFGANRGVYKLNKAIIACNSKKVERALALAGPLESDVKRGFIDQVDNLINQHEKIKMNTADKIQVGLGALFLWKSGMYFLSHDISQINWQLHWSKNEGLLNVGIVSLGLLLAFNGARCSESRNRLAELKKIEKIVQDAPQKSFETIVTHRTHKKPEVQTIKEPLIEAPKG